MVEWIVKKKISLNDNNNNNQFLYVALFTPEVHHKALPTSLPVVPGP